MTFPARPPAPVIPVSESVRRLTTPTRGAYQGEPEDERAPHILVARYRKARKIATAFLASEAQPSADELIAVGEYDAVRELAGKAVGVNTPSRVTWALVVELVNEARSG